MSRPIDADAVKGLIRSGISVDTYADQDYVCELVDDIPTIDVVSEWIPCSERLPEYRKLVLVTTRDLRVKPAYLDSIQDDGTDDLWSIPLDDADCALWNVLAWMPLPKPYGECKGE